MKQSQMHLVTLITHRIWWTVTTGSFWIDFRVLEKRKEIVNLHPTSLVGLPSKHETLLFWGVIHFWARGDQFQQQIFDCFYSSDHYAMKANHMSSEHLNWTTYLRLCGIIWSTNCSMLDKTQHQLQTDKAYQMKWFVELKRVGN